MVNLNKFNTIEDLLKCQRELFTLYTDVGMLDEETEKIWEELSSLCNFLDNTKRTNKKLLEILISVINSREDEYQLQIINGIKSSEKVYKFNSFEDIEVLDKNHIMYWTAVIIAKKDLDILSLAPEKINSAAFFRPELHSEIYKNRSLVLYDAILSEISVEDYLSTEVCVSKLLSIGKKCGLSEKEMKMLEEETLKLYKEEYNNSYLIQNIKKRVKKVGD